MPNDQRLIHTTYDIPQPQGNPCLTVPGCFYWTHTNPIPGNITQCTTNPRLALNIFHARAPSIPTHAAPRREASVNPRAASVRELSRRITSARARACARSHVRAPADTRRTTGSRAARLGLIWTGDWSLLRRCQCQVRRRRSLHACPVCAANCSRAHAVLFYIGFALVLLLWVTKEPLD